MTQRRSRQSSAATRPRPKPIAKCRNSLVVIGQIRMKQLNNSCWHIGGFGHISAACCSVCVIHAAATCSCRLCVLARVVELRSTPPRQAAQEQKIELMPTKRRSASRSFGATPLTSEEFASLKEVAMQRTIPDEHRDRLIEAGYIRELVRRSTSLALTGRGLRRLALGK